VGYKFGNEKIDYLPFEIDDNIEPIYKEFKGWKKDLSNFSDANNLPDELKDYIKFIEEETKVPIKIISIGPDRNQTIFK
jgi:adenylosuccinate synthase